MADVTTVFAAKDESFATTVDKLTDRLAGFSGDMKGFGDRVNDIGQAFSGFAVKVAGIAAAFLGAQTAAQTFGQALNMAGQLKDLSLRTGETVGELAVLQRAFVNTGLSGDEAGQVINRMQRFLINANEAGSEQEKILSQLGLTYEELKQQTPSEQLQTLAQRLSQVENPAEKAKIAMDILGRGGGALLPLLAAMGDELTNAREQLGGYPDALDKAGNAMAEIEDNFNAIKNKAVEFATGLMVDLAPALEEITGDIARLDAAGLGMVFSNAVKEAVKLIDTTYQLTPAFADLKTAIAAILDGNFQDGFKLLFLTFKNTGINAVNELADNFQAGVKTMMGFFSEMFDRNGAFALLMGTVVDIVKNQLISGVGGALADMVRSMGPAFEKVADSIKYNADTAAQQVKTLTFSMGSQFDLVAEQAAKAGSAMPEEFRKHKSALDPLFDLTDEIKEQERLQKEITETLKKNAPEIQKMSSASKDVVSAMEDANEEFRESGRLTNQIKLNLEDSNEFVKDIESAFDLSEDHSGEIQVDLKNTRIDADKTRGFFDLSKTHASKISIHGQEVANHGRAFEGSIKNAKMDANVTANVFAGLTDRMNTAVNATSTMLDKMREAFSFGRDTTREFYEKAKQAGMNINEATKAAADYASRRNEADRDLMSNFHKVRLAEEQKERTLAAAQRADDAKAHATAFKLRLRAEADYTKKLEQLRPDIEKATERAKRLLEEGGEAVKDSAEPVGKGGAAAGSDMADGGSAAGQALTDAADALKGVVDNINQQLALEKTLQLCKEFLQSIDEKLPQHALV